MACISDKSNQTISRANDGVGDEERTFRALKNSVFRKRHDTLENSLKLM